MQNKYAGDIGDYVKFAILRTLSPERRVGVAWWLFPASGPAGDGRHISYLKTPQIPAAQRADWYARGVGGAAAREINKISAARPPIRAPLFRAAGIRRASVTGLPESIPFERFLYFFFSSSLPVFWFGLTRRFLVPACNFILRGTESRSTMAARPPAQPARR